MINKMIRRNKCKSVIDKAEKIGIIVMALLLMPTAVQHIKKIISESYRNLWLRKIKRFNRRWNLLARYVFVNKNGQ